MQARRGFDLLARGDVAGGAEYVRLATNLNDLCGDQPPAPFSDFRTILELELFQPTLLKQNPCGGIEIAWVREEAQFSNGVADDFISGVAADVQEAVVDFDKSPIADGVNRHRVGVRLEGF